MAQPTLDEYLAQARPLNPGYSDAQISEQYHAEFPTPAASGPAPMALDEYVTKARDLNPGYSDAQITERYHQEFGIPKDPPSFGSSFVKGMQQGVQELGASAAGTVERLQTPDDPLKKLAADAAKSFEDTAKTYAPSNTLDNEPWYHRLRDPEVLGNLLGNVMVQSAPSLAGAAVGGVLGGPAGAAAGMTAVTYFQQAGSTYREAYERYKQDGLDDTEAHEKAYTVSGIAGLVSGVVNALAVPASLVAPFTSKLKNLALNYVANVAVDTGDQATQNVLAKATFAPERELTAGIPEAVVGSALLSAPETVGAIRTFAKPKEEPPTDPTQTISPILGAKSTDEAIAHTKAAIEAAPISTDDLDTFITDQANAGREIIASKTVEAERAADQKLLVETFQLASPELYGDAPVTTDERGNTFFQGAPIDVLHPTELPASTAPNEGLSQEKHEVLNAIAGLFGKRVIPYKDQPLLPAGVVGIHPSAIFVSDTAHDADFFSVVMHEALHLMEGTEFHSAFGMAVWENLTPDAKQKAIDRHGDLPHDALLNEIASDVAGTELHKPEVWEKVYRSLHERVGEEQAKAEMVSFVDQIKQLITKMKQLILSHPWATGFGANKKTMAEQYVNDLTKVHDALAAGVANAIYETKTGKPGQGTVALAKKTEKLSRTIVAPDAVKAFTGLATAQRGAPETAMLQVQKAVGGGVLNPVVEHVGDLTHRLTHRSSDGQIEGDNILSKINRAINALTHPYGFEKEHHENLSNNARSRNQPVGEVRAAVDATLLTYAAEHKKLPVYNLPQWLAREASVAVGEQRFKDAERYLKELKTLAGLPNFENIAYEYAKTGYRKPIKAKLIGLTRGKVALQAVSQYALEEPVRGLKVGATVTEEDLAEAGTVAQVTDIISKQGAVENRKSLKETGKTGDVDNKSEKVVNKSEKSLQSADTEGEVQEEYDYASTQIDLAPALAEKVLAIGRQIKDEDLAEKGREDQPHLTVLYGLHTEDPKQATALLQGEKPIKATIGDLGMFEREDGDVVVLMVDSTQLVELNKKLSDNLEHTTDFAYTPHITIAFVKEGLGKGYVSSLRNTLKNQIVTANEISFSDKQGEKTPIKLGEEAKFSKKMVNLEHYSRKEGLRDISPRYHGTGQIGAERTRMANEGKDYLPRSYFYRAGTVPERRFQGLTRYRAAVPEDRLVDLATLKGTPSERERAAKKSGALGFYNSESSMPEAVALFEPVKTTNRLTGPRFSPKVWFSAMGNLLAQKMPANASKEQVQNLLKGPGIKEDEVKWTGIQDYLDAQTGPINKHNLLKWLEAHDVQVNEVVKDGSNAVEPIMSIADFSDTWNAIGTRSDFDAEIIHTDENYIVRVGSQYLGSDDQRIVETRKEAWPFKTFSDASEAAYEELVSGPARDESEDRGVTTRYEGYKLPGGTDYTELLLTLPTAPNTVPTSELVSIHDDTKNFRSTHFDEPNILAHVRFDTRKDGAGKTVLFLEEVQSDWGETGREKGFQTNKVYVVKVKGSGNFITVKSTRAEAERAAKEFSGVVEEQDRQPGDTIGVPDAPFVTKTDAWAGLILKRMLRWASEHNYDRLAWTSGTQQNERYGLAKTGVEISYYQNDPQNEVGLNDTFNVRVNNKDGRAVYTNSTVDAKELEGVIGKELTQKLVEGQGRPQEESFGKENLRVKILSGLDLEVGGSGMKYFYDQMLPRFMEKYLKRFGTRVDALEIETGKGGFTSDSGDVFEPLQKKIETVHSIALTPEMKDSVINQGQPKFSPQRRQPTYAVDQPGLLDKWIRILQDKNIDIKRIVEALQKAGGSVPDPLNPVFAEEMYQKRDEQRARDFTNDELRPLVDLMRVNKVTVKQLDDYLHARHVIDDNLNARLQAINPDLAQSPNFHKLSGITDAEAQAIVSKANRPVMDVLTRHVDDMVNVTRDLMVSYGLEKQSTIDDWRQQYKHYVPLRREGFDEHGNPTGTGKSVRGSTVQQRGGSGLAVEHILANIAQARDQVVTRGEKMRPVIAFAGLMMLHPNPAIATLDKPATVTYTDPLTGLPVTVPGNLANYQVPTIRRFNPVTGKMHTYPDPMYKGRDNVINFRIKGEDYAIVFNEQNARAMEAAKAFKNLGTAQLTGLMQVIAPYTRYLAAINTQYNPIFGVVNFVRDAQYAMLTLGSTPLAGKQATVLKNALGSLAGIYQDARAVRRGGTTNSATARLWQRFEHVGGPTGYRDLFFSATERAEEIQRMMDPTSWKGTFRPQMLGRRMEETALFKWLSDYNLTMENTIRLGVFKTAIDNGMSDIKAASLAKNITVNFNKKGQIGAQMGSLYAFFNANVQGTARILETVFDRTPTGVRISSVGKKIIAGGILIGVMQTVALTLAGFDDDDPPEFVKQKNLVFPIPGTEKGYAMVPMPLGFNLLPNVGRLAAETVVDVVKGRPAHPFEKGAALLGAIWGMTSPLGGTGSLIQEGAPTVADPFVSLMTNKDWNGRSIAKEDHSTLDPTPGHARAHDTATVWSKILSKGINWATGGTDYTPGVLSPTPDQIDYLVQQATGGVGREISKAAQVAQSAYTGEELPAHKIPLAGRFYGSATGASAVRSRFYDHIKQSNIAYNEFEGRAKAHEPFSQYVKSHPEARFAKAGIEVQRDVAILQKQKAVLIKGGAPKEKVQAQEARITTLMQRFNDLIDKAQERVP